MNTKTLHNIPWSCVRTVPSQLQCFVNNVLITTAVNVAKWGTSTLHEGAINCKLWRILHQSGHRMIPVVMLVVLINRSATNVMKSEPLHFTLNHFLLQWHHCFKWKECSQIDFSWLPSRTGSNGQSKLLSREKTHLSYSLQAQVKACAFSSQLCGLKRPQLSLHQLWASWVTRPAI